MTARPPSPARPVNWANRLTILRLILTPVYAVVFLTLFDTWQGRAASLMLVIVMELTDLFDGVIARRCNLVSNFGKIVDPMADSLSRLTVFLCLIPFDVAGPYTALLVLPMIYRDSMMSTLRVFCAHKGVVVAARQAGKIKAIIQAIVIVAVLLLLVAEKAFALAPFSWTIYFALILPATLVVIFSAYDYIRANWTILRPTLLGQD